MTFRSDPIILDGCGYIGGYSVDEACVPGVLELVGETAPDLPMGEYIAVSMDTNLIAFTCIDAGN